MSIPKIKREKKYKAVKKLKLILDENQEEILGSIFSEEEISNVKHNRKGTKTYALKLILKRGKRIE